MKVGASSTKSTEGGGKGFLSANHPNFDFLEQQPPLEAEEEETDDYPLTEHDVERLLRELRESKEQPESLNEMQTPKKNSLANEHEELYKIHDNIKSMQENIEQLQDAFKKELMKEDSGVDVEVEGNAQGGPTSNRNLQKTMTPAKFSEPKASVRRNVEGQKAGAASREKVVPSLGLSKLKHTSAHQKAGPQVIYY